MQSEQGYSIILPFLFPNTNHYFQILHFNFSRLRFKQLDQILVIKQHVLMHLNHETYKNVINLLEVKRKHCFINYQIQF